MGYTAHILRPRQAHLKRAIRQTAHFCAGGAKTGVHAHEPVCTLTTVLRSFARLVPMRKTRHPFLLPSSSPFFLSSPGSFLVSDIAHGGGSIMTIVLVAGVIRSRRFLSPGGPLSRVLQPVAFAGGVLTHRVPICTSQQRRDSAGWRLGSLCTMPGGCLPPPAHWPSRTKPCRDPDPPLDITRQIGHRGEEPVNGGSPLGAPPSNKVASIV